MKFYIPEDDYMWLEQAAIRLHKEEAIRRPTPNAFAKAATYKWYNEVNEVLRKEQENRSQITGY